MDKIAKINNNNNCVVLKFGRIVEGNVPNNVLNAPVYGEGGQQEAEGRN